MKRHFLYRTVLKLFNFHKSPERWGLLSLPFYRTGKETGSECYIFETSALLTINPLALKICWDPEQSCLSHVAASRSRSGSPGQAKPLRCSLPGN